MNIKDFSKLTGLTPRAIRFYEERGLLKSQRDPANKYRVYHQDQIPFAERINGFRKLGFSISDIAEMLKVSPDLSVEKLSERLGSNLDKLNSDLNSLQKKIHDTNALISATRTGGILSGKQRENLRALNLSELSNWTLNYLEACLKKRKLGHDEELQMVACAYADLIFRVGSMGTVGGSQILTL